MPNVLLITSTIAPRTAVPGLAVRDPKIRLAQYRKAFEYYCQALRRNDVDHIVYVDNSGHDLGELQQVAADSGVSDAVEFISYIAADDPHAGRFALELSLLDYAMRHSVTVKQHSGAVIWKLTGRYVIANIGRIIATERSKQQADLYLNCRDLPSPWADFYLAGFTARGFADFLRGRMDLYRGPGDGERILRREVARLMSEDQQVVPRFTLVPDVDGVRGYDGGSYKSGREAWKYRLRVIAGRLLPGLWI